MFFIYFIFTAIVSFIGGYILGKIKVTMSKEKEIINTETIIRPEIIVQETKEVIPIYASYEVPKYLEDRIREDEIKTALKMEIMKNAEKFVEFDDNYDVVNLQKIYKARLRVVE